MPYRRIPGTDVQYALIAFDKSGNERTDDPDGANGRFSDRILNDVKADLPTNVFFFSHGWKGDFDGAVDQYNRWIKAMVDLPDDRARMGKVFEPYWIGLHWPSLPWGGENLAAGSFDETGGDLDALKQHYIEELGDTPEVRANLEVIFKEQETNAAALVMPPHVSEAYRKLADSIGYTGTGPGSAPDAEGKPFDPEAAFEAYSDSGDFAGGGIGGALLSPLRQMSFWAMKKRARLIGEGGMHDFIAALQQALPKTSFHLMGHSFGCVIVSSILGGKGGQTALPRQIDSLALVQGALSLWAYADHIKDSSGGPGYFHAAFRRPAVRGPIVVTRSRFDSAVGAAYPAAVALVLSNPDFAPDDDLVPASLPLYGGIGTFGIRSFENLTDRKMLPHTQDYAFESGHIYNLKGDDFIPSHTGIDGPEVAHAIWQAAYYSIAPKVAGAG